MDDGIPYEIWAIFEWLVTPFRLANALSTFQKYINWVLCEYLDEFVSADIDDVLIFMTGSLQNTKTTYEQCYERCVRQTSN